MARRWIPAGMLALVFAAALTSCETFSLGGDSKKGEAVPTEGLLSAKLKALEFAMDELPAEDRRYLSEEYAAYGLLDRDPTHQKFLVKLLEGRQPPVVSADGLYSRSSNAQWYNGKPAMKWTASAEKDATNPMRAEVLVGWMHSQYINRFTTYILEYDGAAWQVVDIKLLPEAEAALSGVR